MRHREIRNERHLGPWPRLIFGRLLCRGPSVVSFYILTGAICPCFIDAFFLFDLVSLRLLIALFVFLCAVLFWYPLRL